jgi:hypothetical protein
MVTAAAIARGVLRKRGSSWKSCRSWSSQAQERERDGPAHQRGAGTSSTAPTASTPPSQQLGGTVTFAPRMVDTLEVMKRLEELGLSRTQAEALTRVVTDVLRQNIDALANSYVSNTALQMSELRAESMISGFRAEVMKIQELQEATSIRETERLQANLEKIKSEIRYEVDKLTASQRLELGLEKNRMRDELQSIRDKSNELEIKVDKEVNSLKSGVEQSKNDTIKYMLGVRIRIAWSRAHTRAFEHARTTPLSLLSNLSPCPLAHGCTHRTLTCAFS